MIRRAMGTRSVASPRIATSAISVRGQCPGLLRHIRVARRRLSVAGHRGSLDHDTDPLRSIKDLANEANRSFPRMEGGED